MQDTRDQGQFTDEADADFDEATESPEAGTVDEEKGADSELDQLRKSVQHGTRKITEMGQEKADLQKVIDQQEQRLAQLEAALNARGRDSRDDDTDDYEYYDNTPSRSGNSRQEQIDAKEWALYKQALVELAQDRQQEKQERQVATQRNKLKSAFGLSDEDADVVMAYQKQGDVVSMNRVIQLASTQSGVRKQRSAEREEMRQMAGQTAATGVSSEPASRGDAAGLAAELEKSGDWQDRMARIAEESNDPKLFDKLMKMRKR